MDGWYLDIVDIPSGTEVYRVHMVYIYIYMVSMWITYGNIMYMIYDKTYILLVVYQPL